MDFEEQKDSLFGTRFTPHLIKIPSAGLLQMDVGHVAGAENVGAEETDARPAIG